MLPSRFTSDKSKLPSPPENSAIVSGKVMKFVENPEVSAPWLFTFITSMKIDLDNELYIRGPIEVDGDFLYEINIDLNKSYDYLKIMNMFKNLSEYEINRARFI